MSELMAVGQALAMSSREIAELTGKEHFHVMRDIREMLAALAEDESKFGGIYLDAYSREQACFNLPKDLTITLVAGYNVQMRHAIVCRWQELEAAQAPDLSTEEGRLLMIQELSTRQLALVRENKAQAEQLALAAPKVEYVDRYVAANGAMGFRQVAKLLKAKEPEFRAWLQESKVMYRLGGEWAAYQCHIDAGRFVTKAGVATHNEHAYSRTLFTPKGVNWVAGEWAKHQLAQATQQEAATC